MLSKVWSPHTEFLTLPISPARAPQWTRQPFPAATGQSPMSPNLLRQETLEADGEPAFMPLRAPPRRA